MKHSETKTSSEIRNSAKSDVPPVTPFSQSRPRGYKTFFVLNSVEHEILNPRKYENIKIFSIF